MSLADYLIQNHILTRAQADEAQQASNENTTSFICYLIQNDVFSSEWFLQYCARQFKLSIFDLQHYDKTWLQDQGMKIEFLLRHHVLPLQRQNNTLAIGIVDPTNHAAIQATEFHTGLRITPMLVDAIQLQTILEIYSRHSSLNMQLESALAQLPSKEEALEIEEVDEEPVIQYVNKLIYDAIAERASDIHIEPYEQLCRIRFRRDGLLHEVANIPMPLATRLITRLKIVANLNIAERRLPQDGRFQIARAEIDSTKIDVRLNTCPTLYGEKVALRLIDTKNIKLDIPSLGLTLPQQQLFYEKLSRPEGLILVTGPTGSGKTLTLYSALHHLNCAAKNIFSAEDPIEIELEGINQVAANSKIGLNFATVLRAFLRQDPDVIMVGEIRDKETATVALQAAQTGHLVLSTLHTNSAVETITRLQFMEIDTYNLANALSLIIGERLVRKLCNACKLKSSNNAFVANGCENCCDGYEGRTGIFELLPIDHRFAHLISIRANHLTLLQEAEQQSLPSLWEIGLQKVNEGITSFEEISRVISKQSYLGIVTDE